MNLANFAEKKGAQDMYLILDKEHVQLKQFKRMFKVIDAERVSSASVQDLIRKDLVAKDLDIAFYKINLWRDKRTVESPLCPSHNWALPIRRVVTWTGSDEWNVISEWPLPK